MSDLKSRLYFRVLPCAGALLLAGAISAAAPDGSAGGAYGAAEPPDPAETMIQVLQGPRGSFLGIGVAEITGERAKALNLKEERGVEITNVEADSPASKAGLQKGDVVLDYSGQQVQGTEQFIRLVRETPVGRSVKLLIGRNGATQTLTATTAARKPMQFGPGGEFRVNIPEIRIPDIPRAYLGWRSPALGIEAESVDSQLAEYFGVKEGVLVRSVVKGTAAEKAGLKAGDVITKVDGEKVATARDITNLVRSKREQQTFPLTVVREKREMQVSVTLESVKAVPPAPRAPVPPRSRTVRAPEEKL